MKFRGRMTDLMCIRKFYHILGTMAKLSKVCVLRLIKDKFFLILTETSSSFNGLAGSMSGSPSVWCEMQQDHFFHEYNMEGVSSEEPEIYLEIEADRLVKTLNTLKSSNAVKSLKIKLTRKHSSPCLSFEIELAASTVNGSTLQGQTAANGSLPMSSRVVVHDVPVNIIPRRLWKDLQEPEMQAFDLSLYLPELKQLKHLIEKYKNLGSFVTINANGKGNLNFNLETDQISVVTHFKDLPVPKFDDTWISNNQSRTQQNMLNSSMRNQPAGTSKGDFEEERFFSVRVDLKRLNLILSAEQISPKNIVANLIEKKMIHLFLIHDDVCIQYFIPAVHV